MWRSGGGRSSWTRSGCANSLNATSSRAPSAGCDWPWTSCLTPARGRRVPLTMSTLIFRDGPLSGTRIEVDHEIVVGREDADVNVDIAQITRHHLVLRPTASGGIGLEELGSLNRPRVNGPQIQGRPTLPVPRRRD